MSESVLDALVKLFALIGDIHDETVITSREKDIVRTFLTRHLNQELVARYMKTFEEYLALYNSESILKGSIKERKRVSLNAMRILAICEKINEELQQKQKIYIVIQLIEYLSIEEKITENELDFINTVGSAFHIPDIEFSNIRNFMMNHVNDIVEKSRFLVTDNKKSTSITEIRHLFNEHLKGKILFLNILSTNSFILRYSGNEDLYPEQPEYFSWADIYF